MRHHKVHVSKRGFRVGGVAEFDIRRLLLQDDFARLGDGLLTCAVVVIELERTQWEAVAIRQQHQDDTRSERAAAACDNN
ncbi:hypothetical protein D3C72_1150170 [compost metagenome]